MFQYTGISRHGHLNMYICIDVYICHTVPAYIWKPIHGATFPLQPRNGPEKNYIQVLRQCIPIAIMYTDMHGTRHFSAVL